ncbi:MAG TPA: hypothetical protein VMT73_00980 [Anaerolineales bacterium]|nr:hypothetical protein [Anaerolineales bacterium]
MAKPKLNTDEILKAEFDYISNSAFQANEDRARVASFYLISVGSTVAAILGTQFATDSLRGVAIAFFILFVVLTGLGALTISQLARLRAAWHESVQAMNQLKDFYIKHYPEIEPAFKWRVKSIPNTDKPNSIANLVALEVALLGALTTAAAIYFLLLTFGNVAAWGWLIVCLSFVGGVILQWSLYKHLLVDDYK